jgi:hypothetical protein
MAMGLQVSGEAKVQTGTGASQALEDLGVPIAGGVRWRPRIHREPIYIDSTGHKIPYAHSYQGEDGLVIAHLGVIDTAVLAKIMAVKINSTPGVMIDIGTILEGLTGANAAAHRLAVLSPQGNTPLDFPSAFLLGEPTEINLGTDFSIFRLTWYYYLPGQPGSQNGRILYDRTIP